MNNFKVGDYVVNFGFLAKVVGFHEGDLVLQNERIGKWIASPEKCVPYNR